MWSRVRPAQGDRKSTRLNSSHTVIYTLSLHDALPIWPDRSRVSPRIFNARRISVREVRSRSYVESRAAGSGRSEEHTSELQSHSDLHSFPTRRSSDLAGSFARLASHLQCEAHLSSRGEIAQLCGVACGRLR